MNCRVCRAPLTFVPGKGWLHPDGRLYVQREVRCHDLKVGRMCAGDHCRRCSGSGRILIDDHCAQPVPA